ncbi:Oidioi.mRNA.OKI2018_I69.PAR.g8833.t1.cds [Oikopleura dioica]|uniref:ethanolamine kinase n=1 Tax=Oikopleura dioica TaxID=34765 RepID=A0ABN7RLE1_OIKDI|nr:Oidioi.mRNA.OKI2018_I69.PAR.g8833.t1.cds [Oikopleura dioica]
MKIRRELDSFEKRHPEFTDSGIRSDTSQPTAERICKEEFGEDAVSVFLGEGGQGVVYNCSSEEAGVAYAQKLYKNPFLMDPERAEIVDSAMSNTENGPAIYKFFEENLDVKDCCDLSACEDPPTSGCADCTACDQAAVFGKFEELLYGKDITKSDFDANDEIVYKAFTKKLAKLHQVTQKECDRKVGFCYESWPWNTRAVATHLDSWGVLAKAFLGKLIKEYPSENIKTYDDAVNMLYENLYATMSPTVWAHNDPHPGNIFIRDEGETLDEKMLIIDYDNAEFGMRAWDLMYYANSALLNGEKFQDYINSYVENYNQIGPREFSYEELMQELICVYPWLFFDFASFTFYWDVEVSTACFFAWRVLIEEYENGNLSCPSTGRYPEYPKCYPIA